MTTAHKLIVAMLILITSGSMSLFYSIEGAEPINFVVIYSGGPDTGAEGKNIITQFMQSLSKLTGIQKERFRGSYFNQIDEAMKYLQQNKNSFIMGSIGFYLAHRQSMKLVPLATVKLQGNDKDQFYCIVKKGSYSSLSDLKGKVLAGNVLFEDKKFINAMIFNNELDVSSYFILKPTPRPLSAVRKLTQGQYDAVLLNHIQYHSLEKLDLFKKISVVHRSPKMPALGLMMVQTDRNASLKDKIVKAVTRMCGQEDTKAACKNFGIDGFAAIEPGALNNEITKYESDR